MKASSRIRVKVLEKQRLEFCGDLNDMGTLED